MFRNATPSRIGRPGRGWLASAAAVALILAAVLLPAAPAQAVSGNFVIEYYYSDAGFTNQVGWRIVNRCGGGSGPLWGDVGPYCVQEQDQCRPDPYSGPETKCYIYEWTLGPNGNQVVTNFWSISCSP